MIIKNDKYEDLYMGVKQTDPNVQLVWKSFERRLVDQVDAIVELAHGERELVKSDADWKIVEELVKFYARNWPAEFKEFKESIPDIREYKGEGYSRSREIKHVASMPGRLMNIMKAIYPLQQWDKKFTDKFIKRFPLFKVGDESQGSVSIQL